MSKSTGDAARGPVRVVHLMWRLSLGGGIPIVVRNVAARLDPERVEMSVITVRPITAEDAPAGFAALNVAVTGLGFAGTVRPLTRLRVIVKAGLATRRARPQIVQVHSGTAWMSLLARVLLPRTPFLIEVHDAPGHGRHSASTERFEGLLARRFGYRAICHSTSVQADLERAWRLRPARIVRFPLGIDTRAFATPNTPANTLRGAWRKAHRIADDRPLILYVARLVPSKNVRLLIEVADRLANPAPPAVPSEFTVAVVAEGSELADLAAEIGRRGLVDRVRLLGPSFLPELADAYRSADVFCSTSDYEGFGLAVVEAMAAGLPVVATAVGGVTDLVVDGETGSLVDAGDADALATALRPLLDGPDAPARRARLGRAGRARALARFDVALMAKAFEDLYGSAARSSTR